jgi:hypothetical protein
MNYRQTIFFLALVVFSATMAFGQILVQDDFNYTPGSDLSANGWSKAAALSSMLVTSPGLTYAGYIGSGVGNAVTAVGFTDRYSKSISVPTSGNLYASFMVRVDTATSAGGYLVCFYSNNAARGRFWVRNDGTGKLNFGLSGKSASAVVTYDTTKYSFKTTYLVVLKYLILTTGTTDDKYALYVNPLPGKAEPTPTVGPNTDIGNDLGVNTSGSALSIQGRDSTGALGRVTLDGIRVSQNWNEVLPPPPYYYKGTGALNDPANWGDKNDGSGTPPSDFAADNQLYSVGNTTAVSLTTTWSVTGVGSKVIVGAGVNLTVGSGGILAATVNVNSGGTLTLTQSNYWPAFGDISGTVSFDNASGFSLDADYTFPTSSGYYDVKNGDFNLSGKTLTVRGRFRLNGYKVFGTGTFKLDSAGTLYIYSPNGITASGATGDIQSSVRQFSRYATYAYVGTANQVTGDAIPDSVANLTIQMANRNLTTTLSKFVASNGNLNLTLGKFKLGNFNLWFSNPAGQSDSSYVITDGTGSLIRPVASTSKKTMPVGSAADYRVAAITFPKAPVATNISFRYVTGDPGSVGLPTGATNYYKGGYWAITSDGVPGGSFRMDLNATGVGFDTTSMRVLVRPNNTTAWQYAGSAGGYSAGIVGDSLVTSFGQFAIGLGPKPTAVEQGVTVPKSFSLFDNYPNPFNPSTTIAFELPAEARISLTVFNLLGQQVARLVDEVKSAGRHVVLFDASTLTSGIYFYQINAGSFHQTRKMLLVK